MKLFVAGIHTDAGKTHFCASFCVNLGFDYFKLIQAGVPTDSDLIRKLSPDTRIFKEGVFLQTPASPHLAMSLEGREYDGLKIALPESKNLLIELAGGLFTPLDKSKAMIDFVAKFKHPLILVARYYLGSINHILLSLEALKTRQIKPLCLVMMGQKDALQDEFVKNYSGIKIINLDFFTPHSVKNDEFKAQMNELLTQ